MIKRNVVAITGDMRSRMVSGWDCSGNEIVQLDSKGV